MKHLEKEIRKLANILLYSEMTNKDDIIIEDHYIFIPSIELIFDSDTGEVKVI